MALNPGITINLIPVDENDLATQTQTAATSGSLPALFEAPAETAVSFGTQGILDIDTATRVVGKIGKRPVLFGTAYQSWRPQEKTAITPFPTMVG